MEFVVIADSHGQHNKLNLPKGDLIIHAGDISKRGEKTKLKISSFGSANLTSNTKYLFPETMISFLNAIVMLR
jgi:hypothetical protein